MNEPDPTRAAQYLARTASRCGFPCARIRKRPIRPRASGLGRYGQRDSVVAPWGGEGPCSQEGENTDSNLGHATAVAGSIHAADPAGPLAPANPNIRVMLPDNTAIRSRCTALPLSNDEYTGGGRVSNTTVNTIAASTFVTTLRKWEGRILVLLIAAMMRGFTNTSRAPIRA